MMKMSPTNPEETPAPSADDVAYWLSRPVAERMAELERLRRDAYFAEQAKLGNYPTELPRIQKISRLIRRKAKP